MLLYHLLPKELSGTKLYPLNDLYAIDSVLYDRHARKYEGREATMLQTIPFFDCLWNDAIFLSPVHPAKIIAARMECGLSMQDGTEQEWLVIETEKLDQDKLLLYRHRPRWLIEEEPHVAEYVRFAELSEAEKARLSEMPECAMWAMRKFREKTFFFGCVPHLLYRGAIDIQDSQVIKC